MSYKPSAAPIEEQEPFASMKRLHDDSKRALAEANIVGVTEDEARQRVEAAGLRFRSLAPGGIESADWSATRVSAVVVDGVVREAEVR